MEITYRQVGDYLIPNLEVENDLTPEEEAELKAGRYAKRHKKFLEEEVGWKYDTLLMTGELPRYLLNVERRANDMFDSMVERMAEQQGVNEELKIKDQMLWVQMMNNIRNAAEEIVLSEVVYSI